MYEVPCNFYDIHFNIITCEICSISEADLEPDSVLHGQVAGPSQVTLCVCARRVKADSDGVQWISNRPFHHEEQAPGSKPEPGGSHRGYT